MIAFFLLTLVVTLSNCIINDSLFTNYLSIPTDVGALDAFWYHADENQRLHLRLRTPLTGVSGYVGISFCDNDIPDAVEKDKLDFVFARVLFTYLFFGRYQDNRQFALECDIWVGSFDALTGKAVCGDFHDGKVRLRHNDQSVLLEVGPQSQIGDCDGSVVNNVLDIAFSRPYGTPDTTCRFSFLNGTRNCDRAVKLTANQTVLFTYHASEVCLPGTCTGQHAPTIKHVLDWRRSFLRPAIMMPTPASPLARFVLPRLPPILRAVNPANSNASFFEASWVFNESTNLLMLELVSPAKGWLAIGFRADDALEASAHVKMRAFIAWFDDATGNVRLIEAVSLNSTSAPTPLVAVSSAAVVASSLQGSVFQGGTAIRFAVRVANWSAPSDTLDDNVLRLPFGKAPLIHWAAGSADPVASVNGTCADAVFSNHGARHRYCYVPHQRSRAERGLASDLIVLGGGTALRDDEGRFSAQPESLFAVVWRKLNDTAFRFRMSATTAGYVSVGWRKDGVPDGWHKQSDMIVGWIDERGEPRVLDTWSDNLLQPVSDSSQNVARVSGSSKGGVLTIEFDRLIATGDAANDVDLRDGDVLLQWATFAKAPTVADAAVCDDKQFCYTKHATMQQVGSGVVNFFRAGAVITAAPLGALDDITAADWLAIFVLAVIVVVVAVRVVNACLCNRGHNGVPATGGIGMSSMRESRVITDAGTASGAPAPALLENGGDPNAQLAAGSLSQDDYARYTERVNDSEAASAPSPTTVISDYGRMPADLRYPPQQYGHLMPDETYRRLPVVPRPVLMLRGNDVMFATNGAASDEHGGSGADAWGYEATAEAQPAARLRTEGNAEYGRIDAKMFRTSAPLMAKDYDAMAPKVVASNSALYGAITQMSPLSLAVRPTPLQRAADVLPAPLWGEASSATACLCGALSGAARRRRRR
jgi:hypothetical protein